MDIRNLVFGIFSEGVDRFHHSDFRNTWEKFVINEGSFIFSGGRDWEDYRGIFEGSGFKLEDWVSCDGIEQISVYSHGVRVYHDDSYDGEDFKVFTYERGIWENRLKELYKTISTEQLSLSLA